MVGRRYEKAVLSDDLAEDILAIKYKYGTSDLKTGEFFKVTPLNVKKLRDGQREFIRQVVTRFEAYLDEFETFAKATAKEVPQNKEFVYKYQAEAIKRMANKLGYQRVSDKTGLSVHTLSVIANNHVNLVYLSTYAKLADNVKGFDKTYYRKKNKGEVSNRCQQLREEMGLSQEELSKEVGLGISIIKNLEQNRNEPALVTWHKLADYFGVWTAYLNGSMDRRVR